MPYNYYRKYYVHPKLHIQDPEYFDSSASNVIKKIDAITAEYITKPQSRVNFCYAVLKYCLQLKEVYTYKDAMGDKFIRELYLYMQNTFVTDEYKYGFHEDILKAVCTYLTDPAEQDRRLQRQVNYSTIYHNYNS